MNFYNLLSSKDKVLVFGDFIIDRYNKINSERISSETPIPIYQRKNNVINKLGGAGNVFNNLLNFNINVKILTIVNNEYIDTLISNKYLINVKDNNYKNIIKTRYISNNYQCFRLDDSYEYIMTREVIDSFKDIINNIISQYKVVIISDYNTGIVNDEITKYLIDKCNKLNIITIADPKNKYILYKNCKIIKPNKNDAEKICNFKIKNVEDALKSAEKISYLLNIETCIITLAENGCVVKSKNILKHVPCITNKHNIVMDVTGAGDTFIASMTLFILSNNNFVKMCSLCNIMCSDVIKRNFVSNVNMLYILKKYNNIIRNKQNCYILKKYIVDKKLVFTTGCFDLIHEGHIEVLKKSKEMGDILIVALNDDNSIKRLKGPNRPINNLTTRLAVLSSIKYIDFIVIFSDDSPNDIYNIFNPDLLVKGGDYSFDTIKKIFPKIEKKSFITIPTINNNSSTNIINQIPASIISINEFMNSFNNLINTIEDLEQPPLMEDIKVTLKDDKVIKKYKLEKNIDDKCTICLCPLNKEDLIWELKCKHIFHQDCIKIWLKEYNYKCPVCREEAGEGETDI